MDGQQFQKIQGWFETLDRKFERIQGDLTEVRDTMATKQQLDNQFQALLTAMTNFQQRVFGS